MARVLHVCNTDFYLSKFLKPLIRALVERGHDVECACEIGSASHTGVDVPVHSVTFPRTNSLWNFHRSIRALRKIIRTGKYDVVNSHNRNASMVARVAAWRERVPVNLYTAHGFYFHDDQGRRAREASIALEGALARITDFTLSQSQEDLDLMVRRRLLRCDRAEVIGNGIDTLRFVPTRGRAEAARTLGLTPGTFRIAAVGRIVRGKGFGDLLEAFARFSGRSVEAQLIIVGGTIAHDVDPYEREFGAMAQSLGVSASVITTGIVDNVETWLAASDVFVLPSYREGMPRALLEAMSTGLPVIATDIRGCREIIRNSHDGLLYPPHDVSALVDRLERLYADKMLRERLGTAARTKVAMHFSEADYVRKQIVAMERLAH